MDNKELSQLLRESGYSSTKELQAAMTSRLEKVKAKVSHFLDGLASDPRPYRDRFMKDPIACFGLENYVRPDDRERVASELKLFFEDEEAMNMRGGCLHCMIVVYAAIVAIGGPTAVILVLAAMATTTVAADLLSPIIAILLAAGITISAVLLLNAIRGLGDINAMAKAICHSSGDCRSASV